MTEVSEQRMKLRIEYSRETDLIFIDNIPAYADWLEKKLALRQHDDERSFSQELPEIGEMVMVSDYGKIWILHKVTDIINGKVKTDVGTFNYFERLR